MANDAIEAFRDSARDLLSRQNTIARIRSLRDSETGFDRQSLQALAHAGWFGILVPEEDGGLGLGLPEISAIAHEMGQHLLPEPVIPSAVQAALVLSRCPKSALRSVLLEQLIAGELVAGLAWQDSLGQLECSVDSAAHGSLQNQMLVINGTKQFVTPAAGADGWLIVLSIGNQPAIVWLPANTHGVKLERIRCVDGTWFTKLCLNEAEVARSHILLAGPEVLAMVNEANDLARIVQSSELVGLMRKTLSITIDYLNTRQQFGKPIGSFQALKHRAVDGYVQVELASACVEDVVRQVEEGRTNGLALSVLASRAKARCAYAALLVTRMAIQFHGAMGFTDECDVGLYFKRAMFNAAWLGNQTAHRRRYLKSSAVEGNEAVEESSLAQFPSDADWDNMSEAEFRNMLRAFYAKNYPAHLRNVPRRLHWSEIKSWYLTLSAQGWVAPAWPKKFGGMGLSPEKMIAYVEEQEQYGVARAPDMGIVMIGPLLIQRGSPEQQQKFLPKILAGEHVWCQGYSEPGAGSDLAALRTEAIRQGDEFVVNGQKIWTTLAQDATHMFALVRTDKEAKKQAGISFLLIDLSTPGITIRPIKDIVGYEEFCEVFFDNVRVPAENLVGELNQGWTIAKALLGFERIFLGSPKQSRYALAQLTALAEHLHLMDDPVFVARYAELSLDVADQVSAYSHYAEMVKRGEQLPPSVSLLKIWGTDTYQRICMTMVEYAQEHGATGQTTDFGAEGMNVPAIMFNSIPSTIYGGSSEVQKEIIAKHVLKLPD